ncbi:polysaccharide pyruvyl transferase family protein [Candidatus Omnitrophota bacterium]
MNDGAIRPQRSKFLRYAAAYLPFWQKKGIGLYGYFGHGDLGDDAAFYAGRSLLREPLLPISKRCHAFNPHMLKGLLIGGGAVLKSQCPFIPRRLLTKDKWNFPVVLFSAGVGCDYNQQFSKDAEDKIRKLCRICDYLSVRDKLSQQLLNRLGFSEVAILPHLELALEERPREFDFNKNNFTVGIVLTPHSDFAPETFEKIIDAFSQFTDYLTAQGNDVIFLPFEKQSSENTKESEVISAIIKRLKAKERVRVLEGDIEPQEMLFAIKKYCDMMVCMRLHGAVFSTNAGLPFLCLSYNLMHDGFLGMLDAGDLGMSLFNGFSFQALKNKFEYALENYESIKSRLIGKRDSLRSIIYNQITGIKKVLRLFAQGN